MITCQILVKDNETTIERAIDSLRSLNAQIVVGDLGSQDRTIDICRKKMTSVYDCAEQADMSELRNKMVRSSRYDWQLVIEPWEILTDPAAVKAAITGKPAAYSLQIVQDGVLAYDCRLWHRDLKLQFTNPIHEYLDVADDKTAVLNCLIYSDGGNKVTLEQIKEWRQNSPAASQPIYYEAFWHLGHNQWDRFLNCSAQYLFAEKKANKPTIMMKYYTAVVLCHVKRNAPGAIRHTLECLAVKPLMAELWCLLGDIYYHLMSDYKKAKAFYQNALALGSRRLDGDLWPIEIAKYRVYPETMIGNCERLEKEKPMLIALNQARLAPGSLFPRKHS